MTTTPFWLGETITTEFRWHDNYDGAPDDDTAWTENGTTDQRVLRGGSWNGGSKACRSACRSKLNPDTHLYDIGFRVVME